MNSSLLSGIFNGCKGSDSSKSIASALRTLTWLIADQIENERSLAALSFAPEIASMTIRLEILVVKRVALLDLGQS